MDLLASLRGLNAEDMIRQKLKNTLFRSDLSKLKIKRVLSFFKDMTHGESAESIAERYTNRYRDISSKKKLLLIYSKYDYGYRSSGLSYEYYNFELTLKNMCNIEFVSFDYIGLAMGFGQNKMNAALAELVLQFQPDYILYIHYYDLISSQIWDYVTRICGRTAGWFCDDSWRYDHTKHLDDRFSLIVSTSKRITEKRKSLGLNAITVPWGVNTTIYRPYNLKRDLLVTFVGKAHGDRKKAVYELRNSGISVSTYGEGWPGSKRLDFHQYIDILNRSTIILGLSKSSDGSGTQLKGRDFEAPACGCVLVRVDDGEISEYLDVGTEFVGYYSEEELPFILNSLISDNEKLNRISANARERVVSHHSMESRINNILDCLE